MRFQGKSVLITGAASGIGLATAELIGREGASRVVSVDLAERSCEPNRCELVHLQGNVAD